MVIPAIDILNGKCVRLRRGEFSEKTIYADEPVKIARKWELEGAKYLHVVDLDGALKGFPLNTDLIIQIASAVKIPIQAGGGLRTKEQIQNLIDHGIARGIIGTAACQSEDFLIPLIKKFGAKLAVGIDARDGLVQTKGWTDTTSTKAVDLAVKLVSIGIETLIYTDTARDGMLAGPNIAGIRDFCKKADCAVIASGGVSSVNDIIYLRSLALPNLGGIIVGKALYEGKVSLKNYG